MDNMFGSDAFSPKEIAEKIENVGVAKARLPLLSMIMLGILAGAFIGFGAMFFNLVTSNSTSGYGVTRLLGGLVFSLGLIMVVIAGAELFTGNNLLVMAWADKKITLSELLKNWTIVCIANFVGAFGLAILVYLSKHPEMNNGAVAENYIKIANAKCNLSFQQAFFGGVLCNALVCLAVWMAQAGRSVTDKILAVFLPVTAFVAAGFEHSVANMYFIPMGILLKTEHAVGADLISWQAMFGNLGAVIAGNLIGGGVFVALIYHVIYGRIKQD